MATFNVFISRVIHESTIVGPITADSEDAAREAARALYEECPLEWSTSAVEQLRIEPEIVKR